VYRKPNSKALAAAHHVTVRRPMLDANQKAKAVLDKTLRMTCRFTDLGGGMDLDGCWQPRRGHPDQGDDDDE